MSSKDKQVLEKILSHISAILEYCRDCHSLEEFERDQIRVDATVFNLMQIGELAKTLLSDEVKQQITAVPWNDIYGLRNRIVHGYSGINLRMIWDTVSGDLQPLHEELSSVLRNN